MVRSHHRLQRAPDRADDPGVLGMVHQHLAPDRRLNLRVVGVAPLPVEVDQPMDGLDVARLAARAMGLDVEAPARPGIMVALRRAELGRRHDRRRNGEVEPLGRHHHRHPGDRASAQVRPLLRLDHELDPDLPPEFTDQQQPVEHHRDFAVAFDDHFEEPPVRHQADAGRVAPVEAGRVEELFRRRGIVSGVKGAQFGRIQPALGDQRVVAFGAEAEEQRVVERAAVDRERQGVAPAHVAVEGAPARIEGRQVGVERDLRPAGHRPQVGAVAVRPLAFLEARDVGHRQAAEHQVCLAGIGLGHQETGRGDVHHDAVEIGQLRARRVDAVIVRVALEREARRGSTRPRPPAL